MCLTVPHVREPRGCHRCSHKHAHHACISGGIDWRIHCGGEFPLSDEDKQSGPKHPFGLPGGRPTQPPRAAIRRAPGVERAKAAGCPKRVRVLPVGQELSKLDRSQWKQSPGANPPTWVAKRQACSAATCGRQARTQLESAREERSERKSSCLSSTRTCLACGTKNQSCRR